MSVRVRVVVSPRFLPSVHPSSISHSVGRSVHPLTRPSVRPSCWWILLGKKNKLSKPKSLPLPTRTRLMLSICRVYGLIGWDELHFFCPTFSKSYLRFLFPAIVDSMRQIIRIQHNSREFEWKFILEPNQICQSWRSECEWNVTNVWHKLGSSRSWKNFVLLFMKAGTTVPL